MLSTRRTACRNGGHDFRPEYFQLSCLKLEFPAVPVIALTATADHLTQKDVIEKLGLRSARVFVSSFNRANIHYTVVPKRRSYERLLEYLNKHKGESGILYTLSRQSAETLSLRVLKDALGDEYGYGEIRAVVEGVRNS